MDAITNHPLVLPVCAAASAAGCLSRSALAATGMILAQVDSKTSGLNVYFIIGALVIGLATLVVLFILWIAVRCLVWELKLHRAAAQARKMRIGPNGVPYPPAGRGLCDACAVAFDKVYHLSSGRRLCGECYRREYLSGSGGGEAADHSAAPPIGSDHGR